MKKMIVGVLALSAELDGREKKQLLAFMIRAEQNLEGPNNCRVRCTLGHIPQPQGFSCSPQLIQNHTSAKEPMRIKYDSGYSIRISVYLREGSDGVEHDNVPTEYNIKWLCVVFN